MKRLVLLTLFMVLTVAVVAQSVLDQSVSIELEELSVEEALYKLTDQAGIKISFSNIILPDRLISLSYQGESLSNILEDLLAGSTIGYEAIGGQIVLLPREDKIVHTVNGFLKDAKTGEFLINANIIDLESQQGTSSNAYGFFSFRLPEGKARIAFSYTGYKTEYQEIEIEGPKKLDLALKPTLTLEPIEIIAHRLAFPATSQPQMGYNRINIEQLERLPALAGESDLIRTIQLQPGVQTGADGIGGMHVRGGNNGQNLILLDGVPVYNIAHASGLFSVFNTDAMRSATLYKGGGPARYGGRLSSVIDIRTKEGNREEIKYSGDLGTLAGRVTVDGPIKKGKSSFLLSGRASLVDLYLDPLLQSLNANDDDGEIDYNFYDINLKTNYEFSRKDKLYLSLYSSADSYTNKGMRSDTIRVEENLVEPIYFGEKEEFHESITWQNSVGSLRWNHLISDRLFANLSATYSGLDVNMNYFRADTLIDLIDGELESQMLDVGEYKSRIRDLGLRLDFDYLPLNNHYVKFGVSATHHQFTPSVLAYFTEKSAKQVPPGPQGPPSDVVRSSQITALEYSAYVEDEFSIGKRVSANIGIHSTLFQVGSKNYFSIQPRILARFQAASRWQLEASYGRMTQNIHLLNNSLIGLPTEMWVPSTEQIAPANGWQASLASRWAFHKGDNLSLEAYYKSMEGLLSYVEGSAFLSDWENNVTSGVGTAYGVELLYEKRFGSTSGWIGYGLQWVDRQFDQLNRGQRFPYRYDRRHEVKLAVVHRVEDWLEFSASWALGTGLAFSFPASEYTVTLPGGVEYVVIDYGNKNENRMPYYHRLDFSTNFYINLEKVNHAIRLGVYNIYNRQNPLYYQLQTNFETSGQETERRRTLSEVTLIPVLPSLSYSIDF